MSGSFVPRNLSREDLLALRQHAQELVRMIDAMLAAMPNEANEEARSLPLPTRLFSEGDRSRSPPPFDRANGLAAFLEATPDATTRRRLEVLRAEEAEAAAREAARETQEAHSHMLYSPST